MLLHDPEKVNTFVLSINRILTHSKFTKNELELVKAGIDQSFDIHIQQAETRENIDVKIDNVVNL